MSIVEQLRLQRLEDRVAFLEEVLATLRAKLIKARLDVLESPENGERPMSELPSDEQLRVIADDVHDPTHVIATELLALRAENARLRARVDELQQAMLAPIACDVTLPPATRFRKGVSFATLMAGINQRLRATDG